jgi:hypothetical protein
VNILDTININHASYFFQIIGPKENLLVFLLILRMVLKLNLRMFKAQGLSIIGLKSITIIYLLRALNVTCGNWTWIERITFLSTNQAKHNSQSYNLIIYKLFMNNLLNTINQP